MDEQYVSLEQVLTQEFLSRTEEAADAQWEIDVGKLRMLLSSVTLVQNMKYWWVGELLNRSRDDETKYYGEAIGYKMPNRQSNKFIGTRLSASEAFVFVARKIRNHYTFEEILEFKQISVSALRKAARLPKDVSSHLLRAHVDRLTRGDAIDDSSLTASITAEIHAQMQTTITDTTGQETETGTGPTIKPPKAKELKRKAESLIGTMQLYHSGCVRAEILPSIQDKEMIKGVVDSLQPLVEDLKDALQLE